MTIPHRGWTTHDTYYITASTIQKKRLLQSDLMAGLLLEVLYHYRREKKYLLHEFVVMPNHFHLILTPEVTLERALQFLKGGFSFRAGKELRFSSEIWQTSFYDHRLRDAGEYLRARNYIHQNPVRAGLAKIAEEYPYSSANPQWELDEVPQRLSRNFLRPRYSRPEAPSRPLRAGSAHPVGFGGRLAPGGAGL
ncbi:MAG: REP-associated tyrosine transposase [Terriglobales bacterium]